MSNYIINVRGAILDRKVVGGQPTCITMTGSYAIVADSEQVAIERVCEHVKAAIRYPVRIDNASASGLEQSYVDRIVKRGGTKKITLVR